MGSHRLSPIKMAAGIATAIGHDVLVTRHEHRIVGSPEPSRLRALDHRVCKLHACPADEQAAV